LSYTRQAWELIKEWHHVIKGDLGSTWIANANNRKSC